MPGTELVVVADDGALEQRKRVLYRLRRYPDPLRQFLAMISWRVFLAGKQTLVDGIAICDNLFGVHGEFGIGTDLMDSSLRFDIDSR